MMYQFQFSRNKFSNTTAVMENDQLAQSIGLKSAPTFILVRERKEPLGIVGAQSHSIYQKTISQLEKP
jgi:predicted DsbA family dithiol-disulfide isomerase